MDTYTHPYTTIDQALEALDMAEQDVLADLDGDEEGLDSCWSDVVQAVAVDCAPDVKAELLRQNGLGEVDW